MIPFTRTVVAAGCLSCISMSSWANDVSSSSIDVSGQLTAVSKYVSRGLTNAPENEDLALQASLTLGYGNFYAGYWGSTLGYSYRDLQQGRQYSTDKMEHDFIVGHVSDFKGLTWDLWNATYYYPGGDSTTSNELGLRVSKNVNDQATLTFGVSTYLYDVVYMNQGDTYVSLNYAHQLSDKLTGNLAVAGSYFNDSGKYEGQEFLDTQTDTAFRFASVGLDYAVAPNVNVFSDFILGGYDRSKIKQKNQAVWGLRYSF